MNQKLLEAIEERLIDKMNHYFDEAKKAKEAGNAAHYLTGAAVGVAVGDCARIVRLEFERFEREEKQKGDV